MFITHHHHRSLTLVSWERLMSTLHLCLSMKYFPDKTFYHLSHLLFHCPFMTSSLCDLPSGLFLLTSSIHSWEVPLFGSLSHDQTTLTWVLLPSFFFSFDVTLNENIHIRICRKFCSVLRHCGRSDDLADFSCSRLSFLSYVS